MNLFCLFELKLIFMKRTKQICFALLGVFLLSACTRYIAPPFTDVTKITQLKAGMKVKQVSDILGIDPYDIYYQQETGAQILSFNYRLKNRVMNVYQTVNVAEVGRQTSDEDSQKEGEIYYDKNYKTIYVLFSPTGDMTSYITTAGQQDKGKLILLGNTLRLYDEKNITLLDSTYNKAFNPFYSNRPVRISIDRNGKFLDEDLGGAHHSGGLFRGNLLRRR